MVYKSGEKKNKNKSRLTEHGFVFHASNSSSTLDHTSMNASSSKSLVTPPATPGFSPMFSTLKSQAPLNRTPLPLRTASPQNSRTVLNTRMQQLTYDGENHIRN